MENLHELVMAARDDARSSVSVASDSAYMHDFILICSVVVTSALFSSISVIYLLIY